MNWGNAAGGALSGGMSGAMIGTMVAPGIGTVIGGLAGGLLGGLTGGLFGSKSDDPYEKWIQRANAIADQQYGLSVQAADQLLSNMQGTNQVYRDNIATYSQQFNDAINAAIGSAPSFATATSIAEQNKLATLGEYDRRASRLESDAYEKALAFNEQNLGRYNAFANALTSEAQKIALEGAFLAQPGLKENLRQMDLNIAADLKGILSSDVAAQVARGAAQTGLGSGIQGQMLQNLTLRDLGLTSYGRMDAAVKNQAEISSRIVNPLLSGTSVDRLKLVETLGMNADLVAQLDSNQLESWKKSSLDIEDDRRADAALVLGTRTNAATYDAGMKSLMEGNIYSGTLNTQNNYANLLSNAAIAQGNQKLGITSQQMALKNASDVADTEAFAGLSSSFLDSTATLFGAYYGARGRNLYTGSSTAD